MMLNISVLCANLTADKFVTPVHMEKLLIDVKCPWGKRTEVRYWADPKMMWKVFVKQIISAVQVDDVLNDENGAPLAKFARMKDEKIQPMKVNSVWDTLEKIGLGNNEKLFIIQIERKNAAGETVVSSDTTFFDQENSSGPSQPPTQPKPSETWNTDAPEFRMHLEGLNYEGQCPTVADRKVIVSRGYGTFDWAEDPVGRQCPCCSGKIDARTITKLAVNNCAWQYDGIADSGDPVSNSGIAGDSVVWLPIDKHGWRKLKIETKPY